MRFIDLWQKTKGVDIGKCPKLLQVIKRGADGDPLLIQEINPGVRCTKKKL